MVQVDVFWSYGIGASFATAAAYHLRSGKADEGARRTTRWSDPHLMGAVLYCAVLFAPSGAWLLWGFPDWETMQVASGHAALPGWLVALFAATNVSQGLLGYWVASRLIAAGRAYAAFLQAGVGYLGMFFILVHGWDGRGYQRFFSADRKAFAAWPQSPSAAEALSRMGEWLGSPVARALYGMGLVLVPVMLGLMVTWLRAGRAEAPGRLRLVGAVLGSVLGAALGMAVAASVLVHLLGWWLGLPMAAALAALLVVRREHGVVYRLFGLLDLPDVRSRAAGGALVG